MSLLSGLGIIRSLLFPLAFAATQTLTVSGVPATMDESGEASVAVTFSCTTCTTDSYLRAVFYPSGSSYFGYTQGNDGTWTNAPGGSCTQYFRIAAADMKEGSWSGSLRVKPDKESSYYNGPGEYLFKVGRYTPSCSSASVWSQEATVAITGPTHTPTPNPTNTTAPTNTSVPAATHTAVPTPTGERLSAEPEEALLVTESADADILGTSIASESSEKAVIPRDLKEGSGSGEVGGQSPLVFSLLLVGCGSAMLSVAFAIQKTELWKNTIHLKG